MSNAIEIIGDEVTIEDICSGVMPSLGDKFILVCSEVVNNSGDYRIGFRLERRTDLE